MLTEEEKTHLRMAFDVAIKNSPDSMAAASVLIPLLRKICEPIEQQTSQTSQT
jgi:hypothetical protein